MNFSFQTICHSNLLKNLPERQKEVIIRRFGLEGERETLDSIGRSFEITRERVRQLEEEGLRILENGLDTPAVKNIFSYFENKIKSAGNLKKEDLLLAELGGDKFQNCVFFLLTLGKPFKRFTENQDFYSLWTVDEKSLNKAKKTIESFIKDLKKEKNPLAFSSKVPFSYIEISKNVLKGPSGLYGLKNWPEVNPKSVKDKAYLVLREEEKPLHFSEIVSLINDSSLFNVSKNVIPQTVHNELIKDPRFVLVGRGTYALQEWGYEPGVVREVILKVIEEKGKPMEKDEVIEKVLKQRQVKANTILLNLQNKKYFVKNSEGEYTIRKA
ncbi:MAG: HTH domain-containing protein [Candidatus Nealsonbacteria bacterium]